MRVVVVIHRYIYNVMVLCYIYFIPFSFWLIYALFRCFSMRGSAVKYARICARCARFFANCARKCRKTCAVLPELCGKVQRSMRDCAV